MSFTGPSRKIAFVARIASSFLQSRRPKKGPELHVVAATMYMYHKIWILSRSGNRLLSPNVPPLRTPRRIACHRNFPFFTFLRYEFFIYLKCWAWRRTQRRLERYVRGWDRTYFAGHWIVRTPLLNATVDCSWYRSQTEPSTVLKPIPLYKIRYTSDEGK